MCPVSRAKMRKKMRSGILLVLFLTGMDNALGGIRDDSEKCVVFGECIPCASTEFVSLSMRRSFKSL